MNANRFERLLTYIAGPILILCGLAVGLFTSIGPFTAGHVSGNDLGVMTFSALICGIAIAHGVSIVREGRRRLAGTQHRAEYFTA